MTKQIQSLEDTISNRVLSGRGYEPEIRKLKENGLYQIQSFRDPSVFYIVDMFEGICTCPHFKFRGAECKHLQTVKAKFSREAFERVGVIL